MLNEAGIAAKLFGAKDTEHSKINENLGLPDDPRPRPCSSLLVKWRRSEIAWTNTPAVGSIWTIGSCLQVGSS